MRWRGAKYTRRLMLKAMRQDVRTVRERDPAARSALEVVLCYPGVHAIWSHRVAHALWRGGRRLTARFFSHEAPPLTPIGRHPPPALGPGLFPDHRIGGGPSET